MMPSVDDAPNTVATSDAATGSAPYRRSATQ